MAEKRVVYLDTGHTHSSPIPEAVIAGGFVFVSALRGVAPNTNDLSKDPKEQIEQLFVNLKTVLEHVGATMKDIVKISVYMMSLQGGRKVLNEVWKREFGEDSPARFAVEVTDMGGADDGSLFLFDVIALAPGS